MSLVQARLHRLGRADTTAEALDVAVGIPVHNSLEDVRSCLSSVLATCPPSTRVIVVDDGSDEPTQSWCRQLAGDDDRITLVRHDEALGYTKAANVILRMSDAEATVLLNSDTIVPPGWLQRLAATAQSAPDIGMVGPLSNAASWQSVPDLYATPDRRDFAVNDLPAGWSVADVAFAVAATPSVVVPRVPLLNGFCTLIRRSVLEEIGYLDEVLFPKGYGEENDFAFRATDAGFALALAMDAYVFHAKSRSFTHDVRRVLSTAGSQAFRAKWPKRRIDDAILTMREHPLLVEKREIVRLGCDHAAIARLPRLRAAGLSADVTAGLETLGVPVTRSGKSEASADVVTLSWRGTWEAEVFPGDGDALTGHRLKLGEDPSAATVPPMLDLGEEPTTQARRLTTLLALSTIDGLQPRAAVDESKPVRSDVARSPLPATESKRDPFLRQFDADTATLEANRRVIDLFRRDPHPDLTRVTWFVPSFEHVLRGGLRTIFSVAADLEERFGTCNAFVLCGNDHSDTDGTARHVREHFPDLHAEFHSLRYGDDPSELPASGTAICTLWTTAYVQMRYNRCEAKFYFVQDWEPSFYAAGARSALIEQTYRLGYGMLANSPGVADRCLQFDDLVGMFRPGVDTSLFHPVDDDSRAGRRQQVVFYGRPGNARNGFDLGAEALARVKETLGRRVDIVSVGADYDPAQYGLAKVLRNLGVLRSMDEVAELYRRSAVGLVFMFTAHPSYQPLEYMASGCATVTNFNPSNSWLLRDRENCRIAPTTPTSVAETILEVLDDDDLRSTLAEGGLQTAATLRWDDAFESIRSFLTDPVSHRYERM